MSSRWLIPLTMVAACFVIIVRVPTTARAQTSAPAAAKPTAALIDFDKAPLVSLLEAELLGGDAATWVERTEIAKVLDEQKLQTLFAPAAGSERARIGKVLKADVLVLIRSGRAENVPYLDVVVSEVTRGLRLVNQRVPETDNAEQDVARIVKLIAAGMQRHGQQIQAIYSVPPFLSEDLLFEHDDLRAAYARLVEQRLLEHPGILVVELAEAEAITKELTLAAEKLDRQLPIMLLGQYRNEGKSDDRRVTVQLALKRGATEIGKNTQTLKPAEVPHHLREKTGLVASRLIGTQSPVSDPKVEAQQLARRSKDFLKLGNWDEALALNQASLLLDPQQPDLHHDAVVILSKILQRHWSYAPMPLAQAQLAMSYYLRGIDHELSFYRTGGQAPEKSSIRVSLYQLRGESNNLNTHQTSTDELKAYLATVREAHCERFLAHAEQLFRAQKDEEAHEFVSIAFRPLLLEARFAARLRFIEKLQDLPGARVRTKSLAVLGGKEDDLNKPEAQKFLAQLAESKNSEVRAAGEELTEWVASAAKRPNFPLPPEDPAPIGTTLSADHVVRLQPVQFDVPLAFIDGCLPLAPGLDAIWKNGALYFMRKKGVLTTVWNDTELNRTFPRYHDARNQGGICFDGKYVWSTVTHFRDPPYIVAIDTTSDKKWKITTAEGLPFVHDRDGSDRTPQSLSLAPLAPGKVCAIGSFGRAWLATITLGADAPQIEIFHEAKEQANLENVEQWKDTTVAFTPTYVHVITNPTSPSERCIVIGRKAMHREVPTHPLIVDVATLQVSVMNDVLHEQYGPMELCAFQGSLYFQGGMPNNGKRIGLYRISLPGPKRELACEFDVEGRLAVVNDQLTMIGREWWLVDLDKKLLRTAGPVSSWQYQNKYTQITRFTTPPPNAPRLELLAPSQHYGLLSLVRVGSSFNLSQVVFEPKSDGAKQP
jgi:tetratricopeptide (TPR) repeat protein